MTAEIESDFQKRPRVSVVVPLLNEQDSLRELAGAVKSALEPRFTYELIFVDDGSTDRSWSVIEQIKSGGISCQGHAIPQKLWQKYGTGQRI